MTQYVVQHSGSLVDGQPQDISDVVDNLNAIATVVNGNLDETNIAAGANLPLSNVTTVIYNQVALATTWTIVHNLGKFPSVDFVDSGGNVIWPDVQYMDLNTITATFSSPTSGKAYLN